MCWRWSFQASAWTGELLRAFDSLYNWLNTKLNKAVNKIVVGYEETADGSLVLPPPTPVILVGGVRAAGTMDPLVNTAGQLAVTEASAATTATATSATAYGVASSLPSFGAADSNYLVLAYLKRRIFSVDLTSDGAGAVAATTIVPALAGYTGHAQIVGIWANATDAATTFTFACAAGTLLGPAVHVLATTAQSVTQFGAAAAGQTGCPVYIRGTLAADDNKALTVAVAGYAATNTMTVFGYYWYET